MKAEVEILEQIAQINKKFLAQNYWYQVEPISIIEQPRENNYTLKQIVNGYVNFLLEDFDYGLKNSYYWSERLFLPPIDEILPNISSIEISEKEFIDLKLVNRITDKNTILRNKVLKIVLNSLISEINLDEGLKRFDIEVKQLYNIPFVDVCYAYSDIRTIEEFTIWVNNETGNEQGTSPEKIWSSDLLSFNKSIIFNGKFEDLCKIPRSLKVKVLHENGYLYEEVEKTLLINISDTNEITLFFSKQEIYNDFWKSIITDIRNLCEIQGYNIISGDNLEAAKFLMENKIKCTYPPCKNCYISEIITGEEAYNMARNQDSQTWDGCVGSCIMVDIPQTELSRYVDTMYESNGFLIKVSQ